MIKLEKRNVLFITIALIIVAIPIIAGFRIGETEHKTFQESKYGYFWTDQFAEYGKEFTVYFNKTLIPFKLHTNYSITINDKLYYHEYFYEIRDIYNGLYVSEKCCGFHFQVNDYLDNNFVLLLELWENSTRLDYFMLQVVSFI